MNAPKLAPVCRFSRRALYVALASCGICACSDPLAAPVQRTGSHEDVRVTLPEGSFAAGEMAWLTIDVVRPCWNEQATARVEVSWDASRFELNEALSGGHTEAAATDVTGWARIQLTDRDGFSGGIRIPFIARGATGADGFRVESFSMSCGGRGLDQA